MTDQVPTEALEAIIADPDSPEVVRAMATELLRLRAALEHITDGPFPIQAGDWRGQAEHMQIVAQQAITPGDQQ